MASQLSASFAGVRAYETASQRCNRTAATLGRCGGWTYRWARWRCRRWDVSSLAGEVEIGAVDEERSLTRQNSGATPDTAATVAWGIGHAFV